MSNRSVELAKSTATRRRPRTGWSVPSMGVAVVVFTWSQQATAFQLLSSSFASRTTPDVNKSILLGPLRRSSKATRTELLLSTLVEYDVEREQKIMGGFMRMSPLVESDVEIDRSVMGRSNSYPFPNADSFNNHDDLDLDQKVQDVEETVGKKIQFKGFSTTSYRGKYRRKALTVAERRGRVLSSTMPGFSAESDRQKAFRDGIRLAERNSGRKFIDTPEKKKQRKKKYGEAMYRKSAAVPDSMVQFADEIHNEDRISRQEEKYYGELTQEAVRLQRIYDSLKEDLNREPTNQEWCAASGKINMKALEQAVEEGFEAKNKLVTSNLRMVQSVVNTYIRNGLSSQYNAGDMMQEGILALIRAAEKFEPERGWKFSTYAMYWVRASVKRSQVSQARALPVPHRVYENHKRLIRVQKELEVTLGRMPTKKELGVSVGMSELQVDRCFTAMRQKFYSLDEEIR
eukprot:CAMPEP_0198142720 /NCGR_PEP_ID=MMETSP1443-20131203/5437_1 /TAXON_ID=186043 /ORGANISM="Entomoneis sp., Strain CCMP2396" /LENGTH=458 /DNA_ID=CAMNT_0043805797 /DNA_START=63 /DNA_END=1435 /DNA_ORIENTATION=-